MYGKGITEAMCTQVRFARQIVHSGPLRWATMDGRNTPYRLVDIYLMRNINFPLFHSLSATVGGARFHLSDLDCLRI